MKNGLAAAFAAANLFGFVASASAQAPVAVVEDVAGKPAGVEFMDYVATGKVIKLGPKDSIVLGYMKSCWREVITGSGTVVVGREQSMIHLATVERTKVDCDASYSQLAEEQGSQSGATVFRSLRPGQKPQRSRHIYGLSPVIEMNGAGTLIIERVDMPGERHEMAVSRQSLVRGKFYDLASTREVLTPGASYVARVGKRQVFFDVDYQSRPGSAPVASRLLRFD